jgi:excisionase family DNA binding protein
MLPNAQQLEPHGNAAFYTVAEAARILRVSPMTLYRSIAESEFPALRIRNRLIIPAAFVDDMAAAAVKSRSTVTPANRSDVPPPN